MPDATGQRDKVIAALAAVRSEVVEGTQNLVDLAHLFFDGNYPGDEGAEEFGESERERLTGDWQESLSAATVRRSRGGKRSADSAAR